MNAWLTNPGIEGVCKQAVLVLADSAAKGVLILLAAWLVVLAMETFVRGRPAPRLVSGARRPAGPARAGRRAAEMATAHPAAQAGSARAGCQQRAPRTIRFGFARRRGSGDAGCGEHAAGPSHSAHSPRRRAVGAGETDFYLCLVDGPVDGHRAVTLVRSGAADPGQQAAPRLRCASIASPGRRWSASLSSRLALRGPFAC